MGLDPGPGVKKAPDHGSRSTTLIKIVPIYKNVFSNHDIFSITFLQVFDKLKEQEPHIL
jgi:hypothetical protein